MVLSQTDRQTDRITNTDAVHYFQGDIQGHSCQRTRHGLWCSHMEFCSVSCIGKAMRAFKIFLLFVTLWHWPLTFDLWPFDILLPYVVGEDSWWTNPSGEFDDCSFSRFGFITDRVRQTDRISHTQTPRNVLLPRLLSAWEISCKQQYRLHCNEGGCILPCYLHQRSRRGVCAHWCLSVCLSVHGISQNVTDRFEENYMEGWTLCQGRCDNCRTNL